MVPGLDPRDASDRLIIAQVSHPLVDSEAQGYEVPIILLIQVVFFIIIISSVVIIITCPTYINNFLRLYVGKHLLIL